MRSLKITILILTSLILTTGAARAHEFWIDPSQFQAKIGDTIQADLRVGQHLRGAKTPYLTHEIERFEVRLDDQVFDYQGNYGDLPAFEWTPIQSGLHRIIHVTKDNTLRYNDDAKFNAFTTEKGYPNLATAHRERWGDQRIIEDYFRYARALIQIGDDAGDDRPEGLVIETILDTNPYQSNGPLSGQLRVRGQPQPNHQVTLITQSGNTRVFTDDQGRFEFARPAEGLVLIDAVLIEPTGSANPAWNSHWASTTIRIP